MTEKSTKKNDGNRRGCDFGEMTGIIGKMTGKSTWKVSGMESFYYYYEQQDQKRIHFTHFTRTS